MKTYPKIKRLGHTSTEGVLKPGTEVRVLEKLDGNNFRFKLDTEHDKLLFGSRNMEFKGDGVPDDPDEVGGQFEDVTNWISENVDIEQLEALQERAGGELVFYGENMVKHSIEYDWDETPQFLLFEVFNHGEKDWLPFNNVQDIGKSLGIPTVPQVDRMEAETFKEEFDPEADDKGVVPDSNYREGLAEGIVLRNIENGRRAKVHSEEFKEKHRKSTGGKHKKEHLNEDTVQVAQMYGTDARIRKHINKLVNEEGEELEMQLMEELPMRVVDDIFEEEYEEIVRSNKTIDMKKFRKKIAKRCVTLLRRRINEEAVQ